MSLLIIAPLMLLGTATGETHIVDIA
jgi:hypothetical protein